MRQALVIALFVGSISACSMIGGREAAPTGFRVTACDAYESLTFAQAAIDLGKLDLAAGFVAAGRSSLAVVPRWEPGEAFVDRLQHVSDVIDVAEAGLPLDLADTEYRELYDRNGFTCDWIFRPLPSPLWPSPDSTLPADRSARR